MALFRRVTVVVVLALAVHAGTARAGTYDVYSCTLPSGKPAPTQGWHAELDNRPGIAVSNSCLSPRTGVPTGALRGDITRPGDVGDLAAWIFTAPKYTTIANF